MQKQILLQRDTLREFRVEDTDAYNVGDLIKADVFAAGDKIDVTGTSKKVKVGLALLNVGISAD